MENNRRPNTQNTRSLSEAQRSGIEMYQLSEQDVNAPNFGPHTLFGINILITEGRAENAGDAFEVVRGLSVRQVRGSVDYGLRREEVTSSSFNRNTLIGMDSLVERGLSENHRAAYELLQGLDDNQTIGVALLGLSRNQVTVPNFGEQTVNAIARLQQQNMTAQEAYELVRELDNEQILGIVDFGLRRDQVRDPNFGQHTRRALHDLTRVRDGQPALSNDQAYNMVRELDESQVSGMMVYNLNRAQVQAPNFGEHTLVGMMDLGLQRRVNDDHAAFGILEGLNDFQTLAITEYRLDREQVITPTFNRINFEVMEQLRAANPGAQGQHLYEVARDMLEFQARALTEGLTIEQLGIGRNGNEFVLNDPEVEGISGTVVDAQSHLMRVEGLSHEDALGVARALDSNQTIGMIDFGLSLEQVQSSYFVHREEVLGALSEALQQLEVREFPIEEGQRQLAREAFDGLRSGAASMPVRVSGLDDSETDEERALGQEKPVKAPHEGQLEDDRKPAAKETPQQTNAVGSQRENTEQDGIQTSGEGIIDLQAFLEYARPRDVLDIFGGLGQSSEETTNRMVAAESPQDLAQRSPIQRNSTNRSDQKKEGLDTKKYRKPKR